MNESKKTADAKDVLPFTDHSSRFTSDDEIDLREYIEVIRKRWKVITFIMVAVTLATLIFSLLQKPVYEAKTTILIRSGGDSSALSQFAGLAGMAGGRLNMQGNTLSDLTSVLQSKVVAEKVLDDLRLQEKIKGWNSPRIKKQVLISAVQGMLKKPKSDGNLIELTVGMEDKELVADIANAYVVALGYHWRDLNASAAQGKLKYIQSELPRVEKELAAVKDKLRLVQNTRGGAFNNLGGVQSDFEIYNDVYIMLRKELESAKLETSKDMPPFSVVDKAEKPSNKSKPKTKSNVLVGLVLGVFSGVLLAFFREYWETSGEYK